MTNAFDKLLRDSLRTQTPPDGSGECLDGELLAAWFDGTLSPAERASVETHAAACSRCQAMVAALVRTDRPSPRVWWQTPAVRWLVPLAVAAMLVVIIRVVPRDDSAEQPQVAARADAGTTAGSQPPAAAADRQSLAAEQARDVAPGSSDAAKALADSPGRRRSDPAEKPASAAPVAPPRGAVVAEGGARSQAEPGALADAPIARSRTELPGAAPSPAVTAPTVEPLKEQVGIAAQLPPPSAPPLAKASPAPTAPPAAAAAGAETITSRMAQAQGASAASPVYPLADTAAVSAGRAGRGGGAGGGLIVTPNRVVRWRIGGNGQVERSADAGATWQPQSVGVHTTLTAGSAPSTDVCWLVGWRGVVLKTSDSGRTWTLVGFPETVDLVSVAAADDKTAAVVSAGGRRYQTVDGGITWK